MKIEVMLYVLEKRLQFKAVEKQYLKYRKSNLELLNANTSLLMIYMGDDEFKKMNKDFNKTYKKVLENYKIYNEYYNQSFWGIGLNLLYEDMKKEILDWGNRQRIEFQQRLHERIPLGNLPCYQG